MMRAIADNGRFVLAEDGPCLLFIERRGLIPGWTIFVVGLLTAILVVNAALLLGFGVLQRDSRCFVGLGVLAAAALTGWACVALIRRRSARAARGLDPAEALVVLDREVGVLRHRGRVLAPLAQVRFVRRFQLTSSSRALHVVWPDGDLAIYRGDPFTGPIDDPIAQLESRGLRVV